MMLKARLSSLLFAVLASLSLASVAAQAPKTDTPPPAAVQPAQTSTVDLNTADAETLQQALIGIGAVKAQAIVDHRTTNGPFASVDELLEVKGIGAATLEKNRDKLHVK